MREEGGAAGGEHGFEGGGALSEEREGSQLPVRESAFVGEALAVYVDGVQDGCAGWGGIEGGDTDSLASVSDEFGQSQKAAVSERCVMG